MNFIDKTCVFIGLLLLTVLGFSDEKPVGMRGGGVDFNGSKRIPSYVWINATFGGYNSTKSPHKMKFKVSPLKQDNFAVYEYLTMLPADSKTTFPVPISGGETEKYALDLILDGQQSHGGISREHLALIASKHHHAVAIMNDNDDLLT
jgi:hypothetical protein